MPKPTIRKLKSILLLVVPPADGVLPGHPPPEAGQFYAISWEPVYAGTLVTRASWPKIPDVRRRVLRESQEVPRRVTEGTYRAAQKSDGAWQLS
jgi:hypothetical protein